MANRVLTISEARAVSRWWYAARCPDCGDVVPYQPDPENMRLTFGGYINEDATVLFVCCHCERDVRVRPEDLYHADLAD